MAESGAGFHRSLDVTDSGDVPRRAIIKGPFSQLLHPTGLAINPRHGEIYVTDSIRNGLFTFLTPDFSDEFRNSRHRAADVKSHRNGLSGKGGGCYTRHSHL